MHEETAQRTSQHAEGWNLSHVLCTHKSNYHLLNLRGLKTARATSISKWREQRQQVALPEQGGGLDDVHVPSNLNHSVLASYGKLSARIPKPCAQSEPAQSHRAEKTS